MNKVKSFLDTRSCCIMVIFTIFNIVFFHTKNTTGEQKQKNKTQYVSEFFHPTKSQIDRVISRGGLVDWDYLAAKRPLKITSIELIGFEQFNNGEELRLTIEEPKFLQMFDIGLNPQLMRRPGYSDLTKYKLTVGCGIEPVGVILLNTPKKQILIGISCLGFQLHGSTPNILSSFESWMMAKALDDIIHDHCGRHIDKSTYGRLSGQRALEQQKKLYEDLNKPVQE